MKRTILSTVVLFALAACGPAPSGSEAPKPSSRGGDIGSHVQWPPGISEQGTTIAVGDERLATNIVLAIDVSSSMDGRCDGERKINAAQAAAIEFLDLVPADAAVGLVTFGGNGASILVPAEHNNIDRVRSAIESLRAGGGTPMGDAVARSLDELNRRGVIQGGYGDYHMVVLGDGAPNNVGYTTRMMDTVVAETPINLHTIGFCADLSVLDRLGVNYTAANDVRSLRNAFRSVLAESEGYGQDEDWEDF